ncbi:uncharacterized protein I303_104469 [Kwoniella dejecticola CBS 10117]|uniref:Zn(2)-C6 fungal-type domain-containing protein n=1 Tax=Kwoniella dejecticola CBS 10117 TaxID=1296121 RepID=A0A1A6A577_9TREE|nr:uncharacterized protein I303_04553 [Kwoniella dejecticola CBS 10117]OBR85220.1 hypothetical protein I303_04553 [Kwoniella dejecticola CBS 10117]
MPAVTACLACRALKAKCRRDDVKDDCLRCSRLGIACESVPRKLGRRLGSKNRPKSGSTSSPSLQTTPRSVKQPRISIKSPSPRHHAREYADEAETPRDGNTRHCTPLSTSQHQQTSSGAAQPFSNMLNVLAKVADEMPPNQLPSIPQNNLISSPETATSPYSVFDRRKFLDMYRQASRSLDPDPYMGMAVLEEGLDLLLNNDPDERETKILPSEEVVYSRVDQPRRDLADEWDVLTNGSLSEHEVEDLLDVYWTRVNPIIRLLDPKIYTLQYMRSTSCFLVSTVLQVAAQCLPVSRHSSSLVSRLDQHIDLLHSEIVKKGLQSLEVCQGLLIYSTYMRANKQHQTWQFIAQAISMAIELRLDVNASPTWHSTEPIHSHLRASVKRRNIQRFWMCLSEWDRRLAFIRGRRPLLRDTMLTSTNSLRTWWCEPDALDCDVMTCATISFRGPVGTVQRNMQRAMATHELLSFEKHLANVDSEMDSWRAEWYNRLSPDDKQRADHDIRASRFVLLMTPYDNRLGNEGMPPLARDECLVAALEVCKNAIPLLGGRQMGLPVQNVTAARLYLLGYTSLCALRIMDAALRTRDESRPNMEEELFHLSILSALADKLCKLNVHQNIALIASVLGRRLLHACRKVVNCTLSRETPINPADQMASINTINTGFINNLQQNTHHHHNIFNSNGHGNNNGGLIDDLGGLTGTLVPQDLEFSFDFAHLPNMGMDLFPLFDNNDFGTGYMP